MALISTLTAGAEVMDFNYHPANATLKWWGTTKAESYDVAIRLDDPELVGKQITGFEVNFRTPTATGTKMWLSTDLQLAKNEAGVKVAQANVLSQEVTPSANNISLTLTTPYTITDQGVYVGYSFTIPDASDFGQKNPVAVYEGRNSNGFFIHATRTYPTWQNKSESMELISAINVHIAGAQDYSAAISSVQRDYTLPGKKSTLNATIVNHGLKPISSLDYTLSVAGTEQTGKLDFNPPVPADFNQPRAIEIPVKPIAEAGTYYGTLIIGKVNDQVNPDPAAKADIEVAVASFTPTRRVLMEEYTYFTCGWCPIGWACLEEMNRLYPEFIGVAWHKPDQLTTSAPLPNSISGAPSSVFNRTEYVYPSFYGMDGAEGVESVWKRLMQQPAIADISVQAQWADPEHSAIQAKATTRFIADEKKADYRLAFMVVENGMKDSLWVQSNYYAGRTEYSSFPLMEQFIKGEAFVSGLTFNDVMVHTPATWGVKSSIPASFRGGEVMEHSIEIPAKDIVSADGENLVLEPDSMFIVALITDGTTNAVLNATRCHVEASSGISGITSDSESAPEYYDLQGHRISNPSHGLFIQVKNGKATKIVR